LARPGVHETASSNAGKIRRGGLVLSEAQVYALEHKKQVDEAHGEIETHHPGYPGSQDTGAIKDVGRIYQ